MPHGNATHCYLLPPPQEGSCVLALSAGLSLCLLIVRIAMLCEKFRQNFDAFWAGRTRNRKITDKKISAELRAVECFSCYFYSHHFASLID